MNNKKYVLGMGFVETEKNGVSDNEYYDALRIISKRHGLPPYKVDKGIQFIKKTLKTCPQCGDYLHETNIQQSAPRFKDNSLQPFSQDEYICKSCV